MIVTGHLARTPFRRNLPGIHANPFLPEVHFDGVSRGEIPSLADLFAIVQVFPSRTELAILYSPSPDDRYLFTRVGGCTAITLSVLRQLQTTDIALALAAKFECDPVLGELDKLLICQRFATLGKDDACCTYDKREYCKSGQHLVAPDM